MEKNTESYRRKGLNSQLFLLKWPQFHSAELVGRDDTRDCPEKESKHNYFDKKNIPFFSTQLQNNFRNAKSH